MLVPSIGRIGSTLSRIRSAYTIPPFVRFIRDDVYPDPIADIGHDAA
jgi:hypothetical protein